MPLVGTPELTEPMNGFMGFSAWSIRKKLLAVLLPPIILILVVTGYISNQYSAVYLNMALERTVKLQVMAMAHEIELVMDQGREDILSLARGSVSKRELELFLSSSFMIRSSLYREVAFIARNPGQTVYLIHTGDKVVDIPAETLPQLKTNPLLLGSRVTGMPNGSVLLTDMSEVFFPLPQGSEKAHLADETFRLVTPVREPDGNMLGYLILALDAQRLRDILSLYNSSKSPIFAFPRSSERRFAYFFDRQGWMLFQSEASDEGKALDLSNSMARTGYSGDYGKPEYNNAFRPNPVHESYWKMVVDVQGGKSGILNLDSRYEPTRSESDHLYLGYAPVLFRGMADGEPEVIGGVAFVDRTRLTMAAEIRQFDIIFILAVVTVVFISGVITVMSLVITRPIHELSDAVSEMLRLKQFQVITLPDHDQETTALKNAINRMMITLLTQKEEIKLKDKRILSAQQRERALPEEDAQAFVAHPAHKDIADIVGASPIISGLRAEILKAASVDADVLIIGETGTGKELTAEAIHKCSARADRPFISINCGALDENLLLDALFGHVKGAFTEAKTDRKGAFLASNGGTLLLDEIGNASTKVQQALLRALSVRRITPIGSDAEIEIDVRLIAATNVELDVSVREGSFRADLYYRLKVITLRTPPLRDHAEDIPLLAEHFLQEVAQIMKRENFGFSRGAIVRLKSHPWPGNIRELKNVITRAAVMAEGEVIQVEDLRFDEDRIELPDPGNDAKRNAAGQDGAEPAPSLNPRQRKAMPQLLRRGEISRVEYQSIVGAGLPLRTAQYDLNDLIKKGILLRSGKGPATRYVLAKPGKTA
jgi:DNA-binding NtrC family response regulator